MNRRTNIYLNDEDDLALVSIRAYYGLETRASAVRFAIRQVAREIERNVSLAREIEQDVSSKKSQHRKN